MIVGKLLTIKIERARYLRLAIRGITHLILIRQTGLLATTELKRKLA